MNKTNYILDLNNFILENLDIVKYDIDINNYLYKFYTSFSISKAEDSSLTEKEARDIFDGNINNEHKTFFDEIKKEITKISLYQKSYKTNLKKLHDKLEYNNILETIKYIEKHDIYNYIYTNGITSDLLLELHFILTYGLDELFLGLLDNYDPYNSGKLRNKNNIKVGIQKVNNFSNISGNLDTILNLSLNINNIEDIFYIHGFMYNAHIFSNGNKRICRIIEEILLSNIGIHKTISTSHGYYLNQNNYINKLVKCCIYNEDYNSWIDFSYASLLLSGLYNIYNNLKILRTDYIDFISGIDNIKDVLLSKEELSITEITNYIIKNSKVGKTKAKNIMYDELDLISDLLFSYNKGKHTFVGIKIDNNKDYNLLVNKYEDIFHELEKYDKSFKTTNPYLVINNNLK